MTFILLPDVQNTLTEVSDFIDSINVEGAGERWVDRFITFIEDFASSASNVRYALCKDEYLAKSGLSCINFNDWIIAFKIEEDEFVVYQVIRGSILI